MKLLLCKNIDKLGIVGDVVTVPAGYARNYLLPHGLATEPTKGNMRRLAEARRIAERERAAERGRLEALCARLEDVEITLHAKANEEGHLYGSVGTKDIAAALDAEGYFLKPEQILLDTPIRNLDNRSVDIRLDADLTGTIKVWVVREKVDGEEDDETEAEGTDEHTAVTAAEAATDGDGDGA